MRLPALLSTLILAACVAPSAATSSKNAGTILSQTGPEARNAVDSDTRWVCEKVRPVGTMFPEEQCREVRRKKEERQAAQDFLLNAGRVSPPPGS